MASPNSAKGECIMSKTKKATKKTDAKTNAAKRDPDVVPLKEAMAKESAPKYGKATKRKAPKERKFSCLDAAAQVLKASGKPMTTKAMIDAMFEKKLWHSDAPTPAATLYSAILRELQTKKTDSRFKKVDRGQFALKG
jgi:hypothetical protein